MIKKIFFIFSLIFFAITLAMEESSLNPDLVFYLLNKMKNKDTSNELRRQFDILLAMNAKLSSRIVPSIECTEGSSTDNTEDRLDKDALLALTFKQDTSNPVTLVGDKPKYILKLIKRLNDPEFHSKNPSIHSNLLLIGEPGTGKSSLAQLIAQETGRDFYKVPSSALITSYQGSGANTVRSLFTYIRNQGKSAVIFIDEIDGIADITSNDNNREALRTVYELHNQLDHKDNLIVCILATNHLDKIPAPLKSRFHIIKIETPAYKKRFEILKYYAENYGVDEDLLRKIASITTSLSCRHLEDLSREAFQIALEDKQKGDQISSNEAFKSNKTPARESLSSPVDGTPSEKGKEKILSEENSAFSTTSDECSQTLMVTKKHYLIAMYITQTTKLPNEQIRKLLFNYYNGNNTLLTDEILTLAIKETKGLTAQDIEEALENAYELSFERESGLNELDVLAGIYYKQKKKFANGLNRAKLFRYFLSRYNNNIDENTVNILADHTVDQFTAEEIQNIVMKAHDFADAKNSQTIENIDIYIALHQEIRKKEKPFKTIYSKNRTSHQSIGAAIPGPISLNLNHGISSIDEMEEIVPLAEKDDLQGESAKGDSHNKLTRKDYRTKTNPDLIVRSYLIIYFISQEDHDLTFEQIKELIYKTDNFSWYSIEQFIIDARDQSANNGWKLDSLSFLKIRHQYNISNLFNPTKDNSPTQILSKIFYHSDDNSIAKNDALIRSIYNQNISLLNANKSSNSEESNNNQSANKTENTHDNKQIINNKQPAAESNNSGKSKTFDKKLAGKTSRKEQNIYLRKRKTKTEADKNVKVEGTTRTQNTQIGNIKTSPSSNSTQNTNWCSLY